MNSNLDKIRSDQRSKTKPSPKDLLIWDSIKQDLLDYLYTGWKGWLQVAGHKWINRWAKPYINKLAVEIGCGHGHHLALGKNRYMRYIGLDIEYGFLRTMRLRFPGKPVVHGDAYSVPFRDGSIDCILSIYNFEHLRRLQDCLWEIHRVLKAEGELLVAFPLEGGILYRIGRRMTSKRYMEKKYGIDYDAIVRWEHCNDFIEIERQLKEKFWIREKRYLPFPFLPYAQLNVIQCLRACPKPLDHTPRRIA
jgi:SAM-dependent methyltransferase